MLVRRASNATQGSCGKRPRHHPHDTGGGGGDTDVGCEDPASGSAAALFSDAKLSENDVEHPLGFEASRNVPELLSL